MKLETIKKMVQLLPEGSKKDALMKRIRQEEARADGGLHDFYEFDAKGHIKIEEINDAGEVVGVLQDKDNLVVEGSQEIFQRAFSGDPERTLYKNRVPNALTGITGKFHITLPGAISSVVNGVDQLNFAPNVFWKAVDEKQFTVEYAFRPIHVYLKEETSDQVGKKAFSISTKTSTGAIPIPAEIYSTSTNLFIGIGDGLNREVPLNDPRIVYADGFAVAGGKATADTVNAKLTIKEKLSNIELSYEKSDKGGQIDVTVGGVLKETIETYDSALTTPEVATYKLAELNLDVETEIEFKFSGSDPSATTPVVTITGLRTDGLTTSMNSMIHEFENFTKKFDTVMSYSTTNVPPYNVQLQNFPVVPESLKVEYGGTPMEAVTDKEDIAEGKYFLNAEKGIIEFSRTLSGLLVTHDITGEYYDLKAATTLTAQNVTRSFVDEIPTGAADGTNRIFDLSNTSVVAGSLAVKVNDVAVTNFTNTTAGRITFTSAPAAAAVIKVTYKSTSPGRVFTAPVNVKTVKVRDMATGTELALATTDDQFAVGKFRIDAVDARKVIVSDRNANGDQVVNYEFLYASDEAAGFATGYKRAVIEKPKTGAEYPWYQLDKGTVTFVAEFAEKTPNYAVTIREMALFDGPRADDKIPGFTGYPVNAFSLVRVGDTRKETTTGIRVTWTITLLNKDNSPFFGG